MTTPKDDLAKALTDEQLAQALVKEGIGHTETSHFNSTEMLYWFESCGHTATGFVCDPRVAFAVMEKCEEMDTLKCSDGTWSASTYSYTEKVTFTAEDPNLSRAIVRAYLKARGEKG